MRIDVLTIFPDLIRDVLKYSIPRRAIDAGLVDVVAHDLRDYADDKHKTIDDSPYGGGAGMIFKPEPIAHALKALPSGGTRRFSDAARPAIYAIRRQRAVVDGSSHFAVRALSRHR